jgi:hypothetical protein
VVSVQRLSARAALDESPSALAHAETQAAAGDESWGQWVAEYQRGDALILRLELTLELGDGELLSTSMDGFFVENHAHAPRVEQQVAELAVSDLTSLATELRHRGHNLEPRELGEMYVHVELDPAVRRRVQTRAAPS